MDSIDMVDIRTFDLNLLVALDALIVERSVSAAARRVGIGQPAMSHALRRLRDLFGDPLLVRVGSTMQPTARALELAAPVGQVLDDIRRTVLADQVFRPEREERIFRLGASDYSMAALLPGLLESFRQTAPRSRIAAGPIARDDIPARLADGGADLVIGVFRDTPPALRGETLFHEEHVCLFDPEACGIASPITLEQYLALPHYLVSSRIDFSGVMDEQLARQGAHRFIQLSTSSFLAMPFLLRRARAVAMVPARLAVHCRDAVGLAVCPPPLPVNGFEVAMVWHMRTDADPAQRWFRDRVRQAAGAGAP
jgi:DNA-binding transcriptional LysR family regulator